MKNLKTNSDYIVDWKTKLSSDFLNMTPSQEKAIEEGILFRVKCDAKLGFTNIVTLYLRKYGFNQSISVSISTDNSKFATLGYTMTKHHCFVVGTLGGYSCHVKNDKTGKFKKYTGKKALIYC